MKALYDKLPTEEEQPDEEETKSNEGKVKKSFVVTTIQNEIDMDHSDLERRDKSIVLDEQEAIAEEVIVQEGCEKDARQEDPVGKSSEVDVEMEECDSEKRMTDEQKAAHKEPILREASEIVVAEAGPVAKNSEDIDVEMESKGSENIEKDTGNVDKQQPKESE